MFTVGMSSVLTRGGEKVEIISTNGRAPFVIVGYVGEDDGDFPKVWQEDGKFTCYDDEHEFDLILPKPSVTKTIYVNVYDDGELVIWEDEEDAIRSAENRAIKVAHPITFTIELDNET